MRARNCASVATVLLVLSVLLPAGTRAQSEEDEPPAGSFAGQALLGYRSVDLGGSEAKYREDINLEDGPVLFDLDVRLVPDGSLRSFADEIYLDVGDLGSQPYETIRAGARKFGKYQFRYDRRESAYFYMDTLTSDEGTPVVDPRTFDLRRVREVAELDLKLTRSAGLAFGFDTMRRRGDNTDTPRVRRDTFVSERDVDESLRSFWGRFTYTWDKASVLLQAKNRDFKNPVEYVYTGDPQGPSETLDFLSYGYPWSYDSNEVRLQVSARPTSKMDIRVTAEQQDLELEMDTFERWSGTDRNGNPDSRDDAGTGTIDRDLGFLDVDFTWLLGRRVGLVAGYRYSNLEQAGESSLGSLMNTGAWDIKTSAFEVGAQYLASGDVTLTGGLLFEDREVIRAWTSDDEGRDREANTGNLGAFVDVSWNPSRRLEVTADLDINAIDDPYTLASPTNRRRLRVRGRYRWENGLWAMGSFSLNDFDNDNSDWRSDNRRGVVRVGYSTSALNVSGGYSAIRMERGIDQLLNGNTPFPIFYEATSDFFDARLRWFATTRLALVGEVFFYDNAGTFAVERQDYRAAVEYRFLESFVAGLAFRGVDFSQGGTTINDYDARILDLSVGYRW